MKFIIVTSRRSPYVSPIHFYRAMHYSVKRGISIACRLSVCPSVCPWRWWIVIT